MTRRTRAALVLQLVFTSLALAPAGAAAEPTFTLGNVFVADRPVREFTPDGTLVRTLADPSFVQPLDLAFDPAAELLYVTDAPAHDVKVIDPSGAVVRTFGTTVLSLPRAIAVHRGGDIYVADTAGNEVDVFDPSGNHIRAIPVPVPIALAFNSAGDRLYVSESNFSRGVQVFDLAGTALGVLGETADRVTLTNGLAVARDGTLYVGNGGFGGGTDTIERFDSGGAFVGTLAGGLSAPIDLTLDAAGNIWATNTNDFGGQQLHAYDPAGTLIASFGSGLLVQPTGVAIAQLRLDSTPPSITPVVTGTLGANGWYVSDVTVSWQVADDESPAFHSCAPQTLSADTAGTEISCSASSDGGTATASITVKRDTAAPTIAYAGNAGTYLVDQQVQIDCTAADTLSGLASHTCVATARPAYTFPLGTTTLSASATDQAGNTGTASTTFVVHVDPRSLCGLTVQFVRGSPKYASLPASLRALGDRVAAAACAELDAWFASASPSRKAAIVASYQRAVDGLARSGWLTQAQAGVLKNLAGAL